MRQAIAAFFIACFAALSQTAPNSYRRSDPGGGEPSTRFSSGLSVCDEALRDGHWVSRYWLSSAGGRVSAAGRQPFLRNVAV